MSQLTFDTNSQFKTVSFDDGSMSWLFSFEDSISFVVSGFWRLLKDNKIYFVSLYHGHQFGLPKPVDLVENASMFLKEQKLLKIEIDENTADVTLGLTDGIELQVLIASSGYETYQFSILGRKYIGLGGGNIAVF